MSELVLFAAAEARVLTDEVKADAQALWAKLLRLYEGGAHQALGYSSWADYCAAEFDMGKSRSYQMLDAARVVESLPESTNVDSPPTESQARELTPLLDQPEAMAVAWQTAQEVAVEQDRPVTAQDVRELVRPVAPRPESWTEQTDALLESAAADGSEKAARALTAVRDSRVLLRFDQALRQVLTTVESRDNLLDAITRTERERAEDRADLCERMADFITRIGAANARHAAPELRRIK